MILFTIFKCFYRSNMVKKDIYLKRCAMFCIGFLYPWVFFVWFLVFEIWSILYFSHVMHSGLKGKLIKWYRFRKTLFKNFPNPQFTVNHSWIQNRPYLKNEELPEKNLGTQKSVPEHWASSDINIIFYHIWSEKINRLSDQSASSM